MAGLLAARALTEHFDSVTIVERDHFPTEPGGRDGVPQARHIHILLMQGKRILENLFPGILAELTAAGVPTLDWTADGLTLSKAGWLPRFHSDLMIHTCSRDLLEWTVRQRLVAHPKIRFIEGAQAAALLTNDDRTRVSGVKLRIRDRESNGSEAELNADLVVDATGRTSRAPEWLEKMGYDAPAETIINSFQGYATRWYRRPANFKADWQALIIGTKPPNLSRGGGIYPIENDQWIVTLGGVNKDFPPTDEQGFMEFAHSLRSPLLYEALQHAEPISPIYGFQRTENRLRHYEKLARMPEGFVITGDAVCAFNPVYGQGMTVAAIEAVVLDKCLRESTNNLPKRFQKAVAKAVETPWLLATGEDFRWENTEGERPKMTPFTRFVHSYMNSLTALIAEDGDVLKVFYEVAHLLKPPTALFQPMVASRILRRMFRERLQGKRPTRESAYPPAWSEETRAAAR
jgi:2-polyprenyl-6-methoxyphenol hydroxylase-like FAD-dependent oxidoreductase